MARESVDRAPALASCQNPRMLVQDIRHGLRLLRRQPGLTAAAIVTLALATGAATAIFSVIESALIRPLPYPNPEQLVDIGLAPRGWAPSLDDVRAWSAPGSVLSQVAV